MPLSSEMDLWLQRIMLSDDPNWTKVEGLVDWLRFQSKAVRVRFHSRRIRLETVHSSPVAKLRNLGDKARIWERKTLETQRIKVLEAKLFFLERPKLCSLCQRYLAMSSLAKTSLTLKMQSKIQRKLDKAGIKFSMMKNLLEDRK